MKRFPRRVLVVPALLVAAVWALLWLHPAERDDPWYVATALTIGILGAISAAYQLHRTTRWTIRAIGVLCYVLGGASLYLLIGSQHWHRLTPGWREGVTDFAAAVLLVGGPFLLWGLIETTLTDRRERDAADETRHPTGLP